ncbi:MAG: cell wall metabolism sensor histidine kinase WalK [Limnochordia bacterium]|nr:cell wall metabolism sensor histidine kinase WalK [Limnochordia bacterium]
MRKWSFAKPLLFKLTSLALVVTLLSVGVTAFFVARYSQNALKDRAQADLLTEAQMIRLVLQEEPGDLRQRILNLAAATERLITLEDGQGNTVVDTIPEGLEPRDLIAAEVRLEDQGVLRVAVHTKEIQSIYDNLIRGSILIGILVAVAAIVVAFFLNRAITEPLQDLLVAVRRLQEREFGRKVLVQSTDEIGQLGKAFNELSETLEELFFTISDREGTLDTVLTSMDDGVVAVNMRREVILANRAAADLFHHNPEDMIGRNQFEATRNEELSRLLEKTMDGKDSFSQEMRLRPGSERAIAVTSSPLEDQHGKIQGAVAVMRDVTSLRHLEQMRQEFVANVSHELRTPLTSIKGFAETLLNSSFEDRALSERFLGIINTETDRMIALINDLLDLSRIESGKQPFKKGAVDMKRVFEDTVLMLQSKASAKGVTIENNIYSQVMVEGDEKLLKQVALNLVDNGVKYNTEGGKVWIEAEQGLDSVEFIVGDTGLGIATEHLDRIFERFYRVDKGRARHMGGTGLGLAITKHIVDKHKGTIAIESRVGKGTKIRITLKKIS